MKRSAAALSSLLSLPSACALEAGDPADRLVERDGDVGEVEPPKEHGGKGPDTNGPAICNELVAEAQWPAKIGASGIQGVADLWLAPEDCAVLQDDADGDGLPDGQAICDDDVTAAQGLPVGTSHFTTYVAGHGLRCGCTCAPRSSCDSPGPHLEHDAVGAGTYADPYEIYTAEQLWDLAHAPEGWDDSFVQCGDIDLSGFYGVDRPYFVIPSLTGDYDGQGHAIRGFRYDIDGPHYSPPPVLANDGVTVVRGDDTLVGLFGSLDGSVGQLRLLDAVVRVDLGDTPAHWVYAGGLAGFTTGEVWQITATGEIETGVIANYAGALTAQLDGRASDIAVDAEVRGHTAGGLVGLGWWSVIVRATAHATVEAEHGAGAIAGTMLHATASEIDASGVIVAGGFAGGAFGTFSGELAEASADAVSISDYDAGGLAGSFRGQLSRASATGIAIGSAAGGLVGEVGQGSTIVDGYATTDVEGVGSPDDPTVSYAGGVVGYVSDYNDPPVVFTHVYAAGDVVGPQAVGGVVGYSGEGFEPQMCFATGTVSGGDPLPFGHVVGSVDPVNRYNADTNPIVPGQGTPASLAAGDFEDPNASFGYTWPVGAGGWVFTPGELPHLAP